MTLHILRVPMKEISRRPEQQRWCFKCRKRTAHEKVITAPVDSMSYYGPACHLECPVCHEDNSCFPGTWREWAGGETETLIISQFSSERWFEQAREADAALSRVLRVFTDGNKFYPLHPEPPRG